MQNYVEMRIIPENKNLVAKCCSGRVSVILCQVATARKGQYMAPDLFDSKQLRQK